MNVFFNQISKCITFIFILFLSGCSYFVPEYDKPQPDVPEKWQHQSANHIDLTKYAWWKQLNDPTLDHLIEMALKNNSQIQIGLTNVLAAQADLDKAKYSWLPTLGASGNGYAGKSFGVNFQNKSGNPSLDGLGNSLNENFSAGLAGLSIDYSLNIMQLYHAEKIAKLNVDIQQQIKKAADLTIINQVSVAYFSLLAAQEQVAIQSNLKKTQLYLVKARKKAYSLGSITKIEVDEAQQELESLSSQLEILQYDIGKYQNALRLLTNQNPGEVITDSNILALKAEQIPAGLPSSILNNRPDIIMAEFELQQANANIGLARSNFFPSIDLTSLIGGASLSLNKLFSASMGIWSLSAAAKIPVFNMGLMAENDKAEIQYKSAYINYIDTVKSSFSEVDDALNYYNFINRSLAADSKAFSIAKDRYFAVKKMYDVGVLDMTQTLLQDIQLQKTKLAQVQTKSSQLIGLAMVYQSLAAGYDAKLKGVKAISNNEQERKLLPADIGTARNDPEILVEQINMI